MVKDRIPVELEREYQRVRNIGGLFDLVLPLSAAILVVAFSGSEIITPAELQAPLSWLKYGLAAFSVAICLVARTILSRIMSAVRAQVQRGIYRRGRVTYSYLILYVLYLVPAIWGFAYWILTGGLLLLLILVALTVIAYLFLTPRIEYFFQ